MLYFERWARRRGYDTIIGVDEVGRGPLAGPVVVAAVALTREAFKSRIDDSKKLTPRQRQEAFEEILQTSFAGLGVLNEGCVDALNIASACHLAVDQAVLKLMSALNKKGRSVPRPVLLLDGALKTSLAFPTKEIISGDSKSLSIACASIVAKVVRDRMMLIYDGVYPHYGFKAHKGYGTKAHCENIRHFGLSPIHRRTFCGKFV